MVYTEKNLNTGMTGVEFFDPSIIINEQLGRSVLGITAEAQGEADAIHAYFDERSTTGPAFDHAAPFAVQAELLDARCRTWTTQAYMDLLKESYEAQSASSKMVGLASQSEVKPLGRNRREDTPYAHAARQVMVTPLAMAKYQSLYEATVSTGEGLSQVVTGGRYTTEQAAVLAPARVPGTGLRKHRPFGLRRGMTNREFDRFEDKNDISLVDTCADAEVLSNEVASQVDRLFIARALVDFTQIQETSLGRRAGLGMYSTHISQRLDKLAEQSKTMPDINGDYHRAIFDDVVRRYKRALGAVHTASQKDNDAAGMLQGSLAKLERWQTVRIDGEERLRLARELLIARGLGAVAMDEAVQVQVENPEAIKPIIVVPEVAPETPSEITEDVAIIKEPILVEPTVLEVPQSPHVDDLEEDMWFVTETPPEIEAQVVQLGWEVLPQGFSMEDMRRLINDDSILSAPGIVIDWRRIEDLLQLAEMRDGTLYRSKPGDLGCDLVYFVAEFKTPETTIAVADNPVYGNATYVLAEHIMAGTWQETLKLPRQTIRELGGVQKYHTDQRAHLAKVIKTANELLSRPAI